MQPGTRLGPYRILEPLGAGGMGEVWLADDTRLGRKVAVKILAADLADDPDRRARFEREAKAIAALEHPNIVTVYGIEQIDDVHLIAMQLVDGEPLGELVPRDGMPMGRFFDLAIAMADAIAAAHERGVTHRDLKPSNVMVGSDGRPLILDFGLAKFSSVDPTLDSDTGEATRHLTEEGTVLGTVSYMSPEQAEGRSVDTRSDIFSFGVMLYEMATGQQPFKGDTRISVITAIMRDTPEPVTALNHTLPRHLARIVRHCLEKDPERRYQSAKDLRNDLEDLRRELDSDGMVVATQRATGQAPARHSAAGPAESSSGSGRERLAWVLVASLVVLVGVMGWMMWHGSAEPEIRVLRIAAAPPGGVYHPLGQGISAVLEREIPGLRVTMVDSDGSFDNIGLLDRDETELALLQNDVAFNAAKTDRLLGHRSDKIGGIGVLFEEVGQIIARTDAGIDGIQGLRGSRLNIDLPGSGSRFTTELVLEHFGIGVGDIEASELWITDIREQLLDGSVQAAIFWRALPAPFARDMFATGQFELVPVAAELIAGLRSRQPFLTPVTIPALTYPNQDAPVSAVAVKAMLVAHSSLDADLVYEITRAVFGNVADLIAHHPRAADIDPDRAQGLEDGMAIDLHPGAERYRRERASQ